MTTETKKRDTGSRVQAASAASGSVPRFSKFSGVKRNYIIVKRLGVGAESSVRKDPAPADAFAPSCSRTCYIVSVEPYFDRYVHRSEEKNFKILFPFLTFVQSFKIYEFSTLQLIIWQILRISQHGMIF